MKDNHGTKEERITEWVIGFAIAMAVIWKFTGTKMVIEFQKFVDVFIGK